LQRSSIIPRGAFAIAVTGAVVGSIAALVGARSASVVANAVAIAAFVVAWFVRPAPREGAELVAEVSHELRTPLTGILGTLELLAEPSIPLEASEVDELLRVAHGDANHLLQIVGNLHARSRLSRSVLQPETAPSDLRLIVRKAVARVPVVARRCFMSPGDAVVVDGDPQLIMQIATNLVQNIARYAPNGETRIDFSRVGDQFKATFTDSGPGIPSFRAKQVFENCPSAQGLGLGLGLSRDLARAMGGELTLENPGEPGASFALSLPASSEPAAADPEPDYFTSGVVQAHSPRTRLLVDLAKALAEPSLDYVVGGIQKLYAELLGATGAVLFVSRADRTFHSAGTTGAVREVDGEEARELSRIVESGRPVHVDDVATIRWLDESTIGGRAAVLLPVHDADRVVAILAVGWKAPQAIPSGAAMNVAAALADLIAPAIARTALARDVAFERQLRASVIEELPLAVSIFAGDPPQVINWNRKEREMLGIDENEQRPTDLDASQRQFDVRFADGTPLTVDNAPVTTTIRSGEATGPFMLLVRRYDGRMIHARTYCSPFFDDEGNVSGAVVTSEPMETSFSKQSG
jgi:anti-sigma regulatory factor (Ser/Thr protein kinase)